MLCYTYSIFIFTISSFPLEHLQLGPLLLFCSSHPTPGWESRADNVVLWTSANWSFSHSCWKRNSCHSKPTQEAVEDPVNFRNKSCFFGNSNCKNWLHWALILVKYKYIFLNRLTQILSGCLRWLVCFCYVNKYLAF